MLIGLDRQIAELQALLPHCLRADREALQTKLASLAACPERPEGLERLLGRWLAQAEASRLRRERRLASLPRLTYPAGLPISARKDEIVAAIRALDIHGGTTDAPKRAANGH